MACEAAWLVTVRDSEADLCPSNPRLELLLADLLSAKHNMVNDEEF